MLSSTLIHHPFSPALGPDITVTNSLMLKYFCTSLASMVTSPDGRSPMNNETSSPLMLCMWPFFPCAQPALTSTQSSGRNAEVRSADVYSAKAAFAASDTTSSRLSSHLINSSCVGVTFFKIEPRHCHFTHEKIFIKILPTECPCIFLALYLLALSSIVTTVNKSSLWHVGFDLLLLACFAVWDAWDDIDSNDGGWEDIVVIEWWFCYLVNKAKSPL